MATERAFRGGPGQWPYRGSSDMARRDLFKRPRTSAALRLGVSEASVKRTLARQADARHASEAHSVCSSSSAGGLAAAAGAAPTVSAARRRAQVASAPSQQRGSGQPGQPGQQQPSSTRTSSQGLLSSRLAARRAEERMQEAFDGAGGTGGGGGGKPRPYGLFTAGRLGDGSALWQRLPAVPRLRYGELPPLSTAQQLDTLVGDDAQPAATSPSGGVNVSQGNVARKEYTSRSRRAARRVKCGWNAFGSDVLRQRDAATPVPAWLARQPSEARVGGLTLRGSRLRAAT